MTYSDMPTDLHMPNSACSTCHEGTNGDNSAKTEALQEIIDQRQEWTHGMVDEVMATLNAKAVQMGFADAEEAIGDPDVADSDFGKAWTNMEIVAQEGSWGVHNLSYAVGLLKESIASLTGDSNNDGIADAWQAQYFGANWANLADIHGRVTWLMWGRRKGI